jgi:AraC-like DNA-binding protein
VKWVANGDVDGGAHYIRGAVMIGFAELVTTAGGDPIVLVEKAGFSKDVLSEPDGLISWARFGVLMDLAADELGRPSFGLDWALSVPSHFPNVGPVSLMAYFVQTAREWVEAVIQYWSYHTNALALQLLDDPANPHVIFRYHSESLAPATRQQMEYMLGTACRMARTLTDRDENPTVVRFTHGPPLDTALHDAIFRCPVEFDAPNNEFVLPRTMLDYPTNGHLRLFKGVLDRYIRYRIRQMPVYDQTIAATVAAAIRSTIGTGHCSVDFIAHSLGVSTKKLQRLLALENTSFSDILDEVRHSIAVRLLSESDAPISRVAGLLDYSTVPPFTLAFRRWTGVSPRAFRSARLSAPPAEADRPSDS